VLLNLSTEPATLRLTLRLDRPGVTVRLLATSDLAAGPWTEVPTEVSATEGQVQTRIARSTTEAATRFFRLIAQ
jgi:hypothetical protein